MSENWKFQQTVEKERENHIFEENHSNYSTILKINVKQQIYKSMACALGIILIDAKQQLIWKD